MASFLAPLAAPALTGLKYGVSTLVGAPLAATGLGLAANMVRGVGEKIFAPTEAQLEAARKQEKKEDTANEKALKMLELEILRATQGQETLQSLVKGQLDQQTAQTELQRDLLEAATDPDLLREAEGIRTQNKLEQIAAYQRGQMEQTRELTRRQIESDTIKAWQGITQAEINRDTAMGLGMMQIAYQSGMPNPNTLSAAANFAAQGRAGFTAPKSPI